MITISNHTSEKKYIIAQIELPIEIGSNNDFQILNDHAQLQFFKCDTLPPSKNYDNIFLDEIIDRFFSKPEECEEESDIVFKQNNDTEEVDAPYEPMPFCDEETLEETLEEPVPVTINHFSKRERMTDSEVHTFFKNYPIEKRSRSKNTSFRQYKNKRNHRITSKKLDDL